MTVRTRTAVRATALLAFVLHAVAVLLVRGEWSAGARGGWITWMDLPVSLLYLDASGGAFLAWSLVLGGLWWALLGAALAFLVGSLSRRRTA